jgi:pilus assembly protein CpaC
MRNRKSDQREVVARWEHREVVLLRDFLFSFVMAFILAATTLLLGVSQASAQSRSVHLRATNETASIAVAVGKSENVRTDASFIDILVGDPEIADVHPLTDRSLSILGKKIGTTRVSVYAEGKHLIGVFDIEVSYDTSKLQVELSRRFPNARIHLSSVNGRIMLTGSTPDAVTLDKALTLAKQFGPEVINSVSVSQPQQVLLEVRFVEASRSAGRELGINWDVLSKSVTANIGTAGLLSGQTPFGVLVGNLLSKGVQADVIIKALEDRGLARRLAEPNLVALSGDTASFLAGGEFPFPVLSALNQITIEFKRFGVGLAFTPTVLSNGLINLKIEPEVSQLDPTNSVSVGGVQIPSLIVRRASTTVELRDGQSFTVAGLLQSISTTTQEQLPWLSDVPILGTLFRSAAYQKKDTDLAIIVTPRIVRPTRPGDVVRTPFDNTLPANDADFFLAGKAELTRAEARDADGIANIAPLSGHIIDLLGGNPNVAQN